MLKWKRTPLINRSKEQKHNNQDLYIWWESLDHHHIQFKTYFSTHPRLDIIFIDDFEAILSFSSSLLTFHSFYVFHGQLTYFTLKITGCLVASTIHTSSSALLYLLWNLVHNSKNMCCQCQWKCPLNFTCLKVSFFLFPSL